MKLINGQASELKSTKLQVYNRIWRWQPYSSVICFEDLNLLFENIKA